MPEIIDKGLEELRELLEAVLGDYSGLCWEIEIVEPQYFSVNIFDTYKGKENNKILEFRFKKGFLEINVGYDDTIWEEIKYWDSSIKNFYLVFMEWPL